MLKFLLLFCLLNQSIFSDLIILKNDSVLIGKYISEQDTSIQFQVQREIMKIPKSNIKKLELGYSGVSSCIKKTSDWSENCQDFIHQIDKNKIILGRGDALLEKEEIQLSKLDRFKIKKNKKEDKILFVLRPGAEVKIKSAEKNYSGELIEVSLKDLIIKDGKEGKMKLTELDIDEVSWEAKSKISLSFLRYLIPGVMQFQNGKKIKGSVLGFLFLGFIAGAGSEYSKASKAVSEDVDYIIINNNIYVGSNLNENTLYNTHIKNMQYALGGLGLLYLFHSYEVYSHISKSGVKTSIKLNPFGLNENNIMTKNQVFQPIGNQAIEIKFSYSF